LQILRRLCNSTAFFFAADSGVIKVCAFAGNRQETVNVPPGRSVEKVCIESRRASSETRVDVFLPFRQSRARSAENFLGIVNHSAVSAAIKVGASRRIRHIQILLATRLKRLARVTWVERAR